MIGRLTGKPLECGPGELLLDVGGVGYALQIPLSTYYEVSGASASASVTLFVHTHVREDALQLYGFASREERWVFERLIGISGVGPRLALAVLSGIGTAELHQAVESQDHARLQKIPGVGKKTAERVVLELRDKLDPAKGAREPSGRPSAVPDGQGSPREDAISALLNLGYPRDRALRAVDRAIEAADAGAGLETLLKAALSSLVR